MRKQAILTLRRTKMHKHMRECRAICAENGLTVIGVRHKGKHLGVMCSQGEIIVPCTPSDRRWRHYTAAQARRMAQA